MGRRATKPTDKERCLGLLVVDGGDNYDLIWGTVKQDNEMSKNKKYDRMMPKARRDEILDAALALAEERSHVEITREEISERAGVSVGLITHYFGTMPKLKRDVMRAAIRTEILPIIARGIVMGDPHALKAPPELKQRALASLSS